MAKYISRKIARIETSRLNSRLGILDKEARDHVVRLSGLPESAGCIACLEWFDGFGNWIESAYNGKAVPMKKWQRNLTPTGSGNLLTARENRSAIARCL